MRMMIDDMYPAMPWDKLDAVVFDVGNVLLSFQAQELLNLIVPERPDLHPELTWRVFKSPYWCMRDRGTASRDEVIAGMSAGKPEIEPYVRRVMENWRDLPVIPEGVAALQRCKEMGMKLIVLSNYAHEEFSYAEEKYDFFNLFDGKVISGRVHMVKPERAIYDHLIAEFGLDPERTLFIDDNISNIESALNAGWQGLCFNYPGKLKQFIGE